MVKDHFLKKRLKKPKFKYDIKKSLGLKRMQVRCYRFSLCILVAVELKDILEKAFSCMSSKWCRGSISYAITPGYTAHLSSA